MGIHRARQRTLFISILLIAALSTMGSVPLSRALGDAMEQKIDAIAKTGSASPVAPRQTRLSEGEVNSYLNFNLREKIPRGLADPKLSLLGDGRVSGRVFVDIDDFKRHRRSGGVLDPLNYLSGQVPVRASGTLATKAGRGRFYLQAADIHGVPLPKPVLQELVSYFSRSPARPNGFNLNEPFDLPAKIRTVAVETGEAIVVQ